MKLIFFHQLIKIQDNESKHASSNSQQCWRQDVNFSTHIYARRQTRNEPTQPTAYGKVHFINGRGSDYHMRLKERNKQTNKQNQLTKQWHRMLVILIRRAKSHEINSWDNTTGGKKVEIAQEIAVHKFERILGKPKFQMLCASSWINKCTSECFWWQLYLSSKFQEFSTTVLHSGGLLSDYGILSFTNKSIWLNTRPLNIRYICILNSIRPPLGNHLIFGMPCLMC